MERFFSGCFFFFRIGAIFEGFPKRVGCICLSLTYIEITNLGCISKFYFNEFCLSNSEIPFWKTSKLNHQGWGAHLYIIGTTLLISLC